MKKGKEALICSDRKAAMKKIVIFGLTDLALRVSHHILQDSQYEVVAYTVERKYMQEQFFNKPVVPFENIEKYYPPDSVGMLICIGYTDMNMVRKRIYSEAKVKGYRIMSYIHPTATISTDTMGEGTIIFERVIIGQFVKLGAMNVFDIGTAISHHSEIGDFNYFAPSVAMAGYVTVGKNCFFGVNSTIRNKVSISDYTLVGAGCYVSKDTEPYSVQVPVRSVTLEGKSSLDIKLS